MSRGRFQTTAASPVRARPRGTGRRLSALASVYRENVARFELEWFVLQPGTIEIGREGTIALDDPEASRRHVAIELGTDGSPPAVRDLGSRNGTYLDGTRISNGTLHHGAVLRIGGSILVYAEIELDAGMSELVPKGPVGLLRQAAEALVAAAAPSELTVMIHGPTGAGKELLARLVHDASAKKGPWVPINCATFSKELVGSELFGHVAGAFSGATTGRTGLFASASGGTLFLDEIGELPIEQQPMLLRALQEHRIRPVGSDKELEIDVRVVTATHQDLEARVAAGQFREDLYARLAGLKLELPGLSERREEVLHLFFGFLEQQAPPLNIDAAEALLLYAWPQNIRELKHVADRLALFKERLSVIDLGALPAKLREHVPEEAEAEAQPDEPSKDRLLNLLTEYEGNVAQIARALGKHRQQVYRWLEKNELDPTKFRAPE